MRQFKIFIFTALFILLTTGCATNGTKGGEKSASPVLEGVLQRGELVVGTAGNMPPMNMRTRGGEVIGLDVDIARAIPQTLGVTLRLETMPFGDLLSSLEAGEVDLVISNMTMTPERNLKAAFVGPYVRSGKCVLSKSETLAKAEKADTVNKPNVRLTALRGSTSQVFVEELAPEAQFTPADDYDEAVDMVLTDKVDALIADYPICVVSLFRHKDSGLATVITSLIYEPIGIAMPPSDAQLINWMENFLHRLEKTNQLELLRRRWFERGDWLRKLP